MEDDGACSVDSGFCVSLVGSLNARADGPGGCRPLTAGAHDRRRVLLHASPAPYFR